MTAIGVLGEDDTDCRTMRVILQRLLPREVGVQKRAPSSGGCSALRRKASAYMQELADSGCSAIVLVHDLDLNAENFQQNDERAIRAMLGRIQVPAGVEHLFCIPIEELEAWFWSDQRVLDIVGKGHAKAASHPHSIRKPKESLWALSRKAHHRPVYSTNMNEHLAAQLDLDVCARACGAFRDLRDFALRTCGAARG